MIVGVLGAGQLARMLALAGYPLGVRCVFLDPSPDACAAPAGTLITGDYDDAEALARLRGAAQVVTYEFENVPPASLEGLTDVPVYPPMEALFAARDRWREKTLFQALSIPTAPCRAIDGRADLDAALAEIGLPAVLKTRTLGYDGKGQRVLRAPSDVAAAWQALQGAPLILEGFVAFDREVSLIAVRARDGETRFYPLSENTHAGGVLRQSLCRPHDPLAARARDYARRLLEHFDYVGVLALELFVQGDRLLANEIAPRVHNSGHWTIEGAETSQFENHLRAILGLPLGATDPVGHAGMVNFVGRVPDTASVLAVPGAHLHLYGKTPRAGRKLAHATVRAGDEEGLQRALAALAAL